MSIVPTSPPPPHDRSIPNKILACAAIGMGVGFGTCSLAALGAGGNRVIGYFVGIGATIFFISLAVLLVTGVYGIVAAIIRSFKQ